MKLGVRIIGHPSFKRFVLVRDHDGVEEFWDGKGWSRTRGSLYYSEHDMALDYERLELQQTAGLPERVFVTQAIVRVWSSEHIPLQPVKEALYAAATLHLEIDEYGKGPVPGSSTLIDVTWNDATEASPPVQHEGLPVRVFKAPVVVRVFSAYGFDVQALKEYLAAVATLHLNQDKDGSVLVQSRTHVEVHWNDLKEVSHAGRSGQANGGEKPRAS